MVEVNRVSQQVMRWKEVGTYMANCGKGPTEAKWAEVQLRSGLGVAEVFRHMSGQFPTWKQWQAKKKLNVKKIASRRIQTHSLGNTKSQHKTDWTTSPLISLVTQIYMYSMFALDKNMSSTTTETTQKARRGVF